MEANTKEHILVCIDAHPKTALLLRAAKKKAKEEQCNWIALYVESPEHYTTSKKARRRILHFLALAQEMGAKVCQIDGHNIFKSILTFIDQSEKNGDHISHLISGQRTREGFLAELRPSLAGKLAHKLRHKDIKCHIIPLSIRYYTPSWYERIFVRDVTTHDILFAISSVLVAYVASKFLQTMTPYIEWRINIHNVTSFFLLACVITSLRCGLIPGLISAISGFTVVNYLYIMPLYKLGIHNANDGVNASIFLFSAITISLMGAYSQANNAALIQKEKRLHALYHIHRMVSHATSKRDALEILHHELTKLLEMDIAFFLTSVVNNDPTQLTYPSKIELSEEDKKALYVCWENVRTSGLGTLINSHTSWRFEPLITTAGEMGVLGIKIPSSSHIKLDSSFGRLLSALSDQAASILERIELTNMMSESKIRVEKETLRSMLLSSVSHDLKTPLASIIGALSVYKRIQSTGKLSAENAQELIDTALDEAQRLESFISNILEMTRLESGDIVFHLEWIDASIPVINARKRLHQRLHKHRFTADTPEHLSEIQTDPMMIEHVLQNVLDNAAKYSPAGTEISLSCDMSDHHFSYIIRDHGPGIPEDKLKAIFDKYERLKKSDSKVAGTGLGLAICKAIMDHLNGDIYARNHPEGGAEFVISFKHTRVL